MPETTTLATRSGAGTRLVSGFLVARNREDWLGGSGLFRQNDRRAKVQVLHARRADAFDLALVGELDRAAEHHFFGDVRLADGFGEALRIGTLRALEGVRGDEDRLEGEAGVESVEDEVVLRVLLL